jgi:hypothetical protein
LVAGKAYPAANETLVLEKVTLFENVVVPVKVLFEDAVTKASGPPMAMTEVALPLPSSPKP